MNTAGNAHLETLQRLLEHYSPSGQEAGAVRWLLRRMDAIGFDRAFEDDAGNAVGVRGSGPNQVVLLGHIDTVPGEIPVVIDGDAIYGRGAVDAKGPLAAFVDATAVAQLPTGWQVMVIAAVGEEADSAGARYLVHRYRPDLVVIGEPSGWEHITLGYKGSAWIEASVHRPMVHTATDEKSACEMAVGFWRRVESWAEDFNRDRLRQFDQVTPSLRGFHSEELAFEESATLSIAARLPLDFPPHRWLETLFELSDGMSIRTQGEPTPAFRSEKNSQLVRAFLRSIRAQGGRPGFLLKTGTADMNIVAPVWGCPAVAYGPGDSGLDHTPREHLLLAEYNKAIQVLIAVLEALPGG